MLVFSSTKSTRRSLEEVKNGKAGLNQHRKYLLSRVPKSGDYANFQKDTITMKDLAYLTAKTGHEFALLTGKREDVLYHGYPTECVFIDLLYDALKAKHLRIYGHSHPAEIFPVPSGADRETLKEIHQKKSKIISAMSCIEITYTANRFD
ncbi:MAG: hypothetical protein J6C99_10050 [Lachnospiraceae bacterium]|nr:hypothetical protein [Lachnospiraceae bacterium]